MTYLSFSVKAELSLCKSVNNNNKETHHYSLEYFIGLYISVKLITQYRLPLLSNLV